MNQPGFPQQRQPFAPPHPQAWRAPVAQQGPPPGWSRQAWDQPRPGFPLQQQRVLPGWRPAPPPRRRSPLPALAVASTILVVLLFHAFSSQSGDDTVASNYQNEDYVVPRAGEEVSRIPVPEYEEEIDQWLQDNALYSAALAVPVRCEVEPIRDPSALSDDALQVRMRGYVECLTRVWGPVLEAAGHEAYQPTLFVYPAGREVTTSCGTQESINAFYCGADQNLYLAADVLRILPADLARSPEAFDLIVAHEYGHAVQGRSGVFAASHFLTEDSASPSAALEVSRRVEVQADCFAGAAMNSVAESMRTGAAERGTVADISYEIGDDRILERFGQDAEEGDHGTGTNRRLWAERGLQGGELSTCNTFIAPAAEVR